MLSGGGVPSDELPGLAALSGTIHTVRGVQGEASSHQSLKIDPVHAVELEEALFCMSLGQAALNSLGMHW